MAEKKNVTWLSAPAAKYQVSLNQHFSNYFQRLGYEGIKKNYDFSAKYSYLMNDR
jgi:hypothetical protein